jgi:hypothetical protein
VTGSRNQGLSTIVSGLDPAWFGLVMATGIVGIAAGAQGVPFVPTFLAWANILFYAILWSVYLARLVAFPRALFGDLRQHTRAMGFFTIVAGSGVLGSQLLEVGNYRTAATVLWFVALGSWSVIVYAVPVALVAQRERKPRLQRGIQGNWLLWSVGTASVSVLGTQVAPFFGAAAGQIVIWSLLFWLLGVVFYLWVIPLIVQRLFFYDLPPGDLSDILDRYGRRGHRDARRGHAAWGAGGASARRPRRALRRGVDAPVVGNSLLVDTLALRRVLLAARRPAPTGLVRAKLVVGGLPFGHVLGRHRDPLAVHRAARHRR